MEEFGWIVQSFKLTVDGFVLITRHPCVECASVQLCLQTNGREVSNRLTGSGSHLVFAPWELLLLLLLLLLLSLLFLTNN